MKLTHFLLLLILAALSGGACEWGRSNPDVAFINGTIYTGDDSLGRVEALAIREGSVTAVGTTEEIQQKVGPGTKVIDLGGKFVMPGFNDAHTHFALGGRGLLGVNVEGTRSIADFQQRIRDRVGEYKPGEWISGFGWDQSLWKENRMPTRADLDAVSTQHPMFFTRVDGHSSVVNSPALEMAGFTRDTPDPQGGEIVRDAQGEPTGWLKETAADAVSRLIPPPTMERRKQALLLALAEAARLGITSIQDNSDWEDFLAFGELKKDGKLTVRVTEWLPFAAPLEELEQKRREGGTIDPWLRTGALKAMADGSGGSRSAAMFEPFANDPGNRGILFFEPERLKQMVVERDAAGFQIALHAIGDRANRLVLDAFAEAEKVNRRPDPRHKIEHAQYVHREDRARFQQLGVIASMQPAHLLAEIRWTSTLLGRGREYEAYAVRSILDSGGRVALGTDYPVERLNPLRGLYAAVAREFEAGGPDGGWLPEEKITIEEAIRAYTAGSAYAEFEEDRKGTLSPGKFADLIVLSQDITRVAPPELLRTEVLLTMVGGRIVYEKDRAD